MKRALMSLAAVTLVTGALLISTTTGAAPVGYTMMSLDGSGHLYTIDMATGATAAVGDTDLAGSARGLVFAPDGTLFAASAGNLITIDPATAAPTTVGPFGCCSIVTDMAFDAQGDLWMLSGNPSNLYSVDLGTGAATLIGPLGRGPLAGLAGDCTGALYTVVNDTDELVEIDPQTAGSSVVGSLGIDVGGGGMDTDAEGTLWLLDRTTVSGAPSRTYTIDSSTGAATLVAPAVTGNNPSAIGLAPLDCGDVPPTTSSSTTTSTTEPTTSTTHRAGGPATTEPSTTAPPAVAPAAQPVPAQPAFTG
jgi:hypothetical protein